MANQVILKALPFDSHEVISEETGEKEYDRVAYSADLAKWMKTYFSNGILVPNGAVIADEMKVVASSGLNLTVKSGACVINGRTGWVETDTTISVSIGGESDRYDRLVVELNIPNDRAIYLKVLEGGAEPPMLVKTDDVYQMSLAQIKVAAGSSVINSIIDERSDSSLCGISNVLIGVQAPERPTGDSAENISVSDTVAKMFGLSVSEKNVDKALAKSAKIPSNNGSYIALMSNVNAVNNSAAFMPAFPSELDNVRFNLGWQIYRYLSTQYPNIEVTTEQVDRLCEQNDWWNICRNAKDVIDLYTEFITKVRGIPFANYVYSNLGVQIFLDEQGFVDAINTKFGTNHTSIKSLLNNPTDFQNVLRDESLGKSIRYSSYLQDVFFGKNGEFLTLLDGEGTFEIPEGVKTLCYGMVTRGETAGGESSQGFVKVGSFDVSSQNRITYSVSSNSPSAVIGAITVNSGDERLSDSNCSFMLRAGRGGRCETSSSSNIYISSGGGGCFEKGKWSTGPATGGAGGGGAGGGYNTGSGGSLSNTARGGDGSGVGVGGLGAGDKGESDVGIGGVAAKDWISKDAANIVLQSYVLPTFEKDKILQKCAELEKFGGAGGGGNESYTTYNGAGGGAGHGAAGGKTYYRYNADSTGGAGGILTLGGGGGGCMGNGGGSLTGPGGNGAGGALGARRSDESGRKNSTDIGEPAGGLIILFWGGQTGFTD